MNETSRFNLGAVAVIVSCPTLILLMLFIALWSYHELLGWCIVILALLTALILLGLFASNQLNEMAIRRQRFRHQEETPLGHGAAFPQVGRPYDGQAYRSPVREEVYE
jgi:hypothetical protein